MEILSSEVVTEIREDISDDALESMVMVQADCPCRTNSAGPTQNWIG